jgi:hypothetical protein
MKYSLNKKQEGGHNYTVTSSSRQRGIHLLSCLRQYDIESQISGPNFVKESIFYKGIVEQDLLRIRNYLRVNYADSAEIVETGPTSRGEYMFYISSNNEHSQACITDQNVLNMAPLSSNLSFGADKTYSYVVKTDATNALRYYLTRNGHLYDLQRNGLERLDEKPVPR